jgi:hypothetical protein
MLCPFHLGEAEFEIKKLPDRPVPVYRCPDSQCGEEIPSLYVRDYAIYPPVVLSAIGFRGHGKTVYFSSLFRLIRGQALAGVWPGFHTQCMSERDLDTVLKNVQMLNEGKLPGATPKNFPRPTMVRVSGVPMLRDCTLLCYDTGGECFEKATQLVQYASFVRQARTAVFLVSIKSLRDPAAEMHNLLDSYIGGIGDLGGRVEDQHLVVTYSQADELGERLRAWGGLHEYLRQGGIDGLTDPQHYLGRLRQVSAELHAFTSRELGAFQFLNSAQSQFKSVSFAILSALGARPAGDRLTAQVTPRRVLDPMLWVQYKSLPPLKRWIKGLLG